MSPILLRILQLIVLVLIQAVFLFVSAGTFSWSAGWWYIGLYLLMLMGRHDSVVGYGINGSSWRTTLELPL
jgi:hypothetical protein